MSALPRRRHPVAAKDPHLRPPPPPPLQRLRRSVSRDKSGTPLDSRSSSDPMQLPNGASDHKDGQIPDSTAPDGSSKRAHKPPASDNGSSSLSELEEGLDDDHEALAVAGSQADPKDFDSEAETERLEFSPHKPQKQSSATAPNRTVHAISAGDGKAVQPSVETILANSDEFALRDSDQADGGASVTSPTELAKRKRKRTASFSAEAAEGEPKRKRSNSSRHENQSPGTRRKSISMKNAEVVPEETEDAVLDGASPDAAPDDGADQHAETNDATPLPPATEEHDEHALEDGTRLITPDDGLDQPDDLEQGEAGVDVDGNVDAAEVEVEAEAEAEAEVDEEGEEEEGEATAKSEDEIAKKKVAMDALVPIEKLFAIFRDKLFDERLANVAAELELLTRPTPTHPDYLAMRQALDARRDEKIQLEQTSLVYKIRTLENRTIADRAQLHSQFFQAARDIRERHMGILNEEFCRIQKERRQWKAKEPNFVYTFKPNRAELVAQQKAYNKEVSLLSGIARHVGFPAAPMLEPARPAEIEDDFKAMRLKSRPTSLAAQLANSSRADEVAAKEQFLESTPWANPNHPAHQQALLVDHHSSAQQEHPRAPLGTPANQRWLVDQQAPTGSASTAAANASEPPSSALARPHASQSSAQQPQRPQRPPEESSSPLEAMKYQRHDKPAPLRLTTPAFSPPTAHTSPAQPLPQPQQSEQRDEQAARRPSLHVNGNDAVGREPPSPPFATSAPHDAGSAQGRPAPDAAAESFSFAPRAAAGA